MGLNIYFKAHYGLMHIQNNFFLVQISLNEGILFLGHNNVQVLQYALSNPLFCRQKVDTVWKINANALGAGQWQMWTFFRKVVFKATVGPLLLNPLAGFCALQWFPLILLMHVVFYQ